MPYKSDAQRRYFNANREKLEAEGVDVDHWNEVSKGKKLPEKAKKATEKKAMRSPPDQVSQLPRRGQSDDWSLFPDYEQVATMPKWEDWVRGHRFFKPTGRKPGELRELNQRAFGHRFPAPPKAPKPPKPTSPTSPVSTPLSTSGMAASQLGKQAAAGSLTPTPSVIQQLKAIKSRSDVGDYAAKEQMLRELLAKHRQDFIVDDPKPKYPGITHTPSGFRMHAPRRVTQGLSVVEPLGKQAGIRGDVWSASPHLGKQAAALSDQDVMPYDGRHGARSKTASFASVIEAIKHHAPRGRVFDTAVGSGLGAVAGVGTAGVRNYLAPADKKDNKRYLTHALAGAGLGAVGGNVMGDRMRRYLSNSVETSGYGSSGQFESLIPTSSKQLYDRLIADKPSYGEEGVDSGPNAQAARELWRHSMDIPVRNPMFSQVSPNTYGYNPANLPKKDDLDLDFVLGRYQEHSDDGGTRISDRYDFDLHPGERKTFKSLLRAKLTGEPADMSGFDGSYVRSSGDVDRDEILRSYFARLAAQSLTNMDGGAYLNLRHSKEGQPVATPQPVSTSRQ